MDLARLRQEYAAVGLDVDDLAPDPITQFTVWLTAAAAAGVREPNAMVLATAGADAVPSVRTVLLKGLGADGFVFFTSYRSRKARQIADNGHVALLFPWIDLGRQVSVQGVAQTVPTGESDAYFATRPRGAQLGAWASRQSDELPGREALDASADEVARRFAGASVPRPEGWGGYRVAPFEVEFWQGRPNRLHDRLRYRRSGEEWILERLSP